MPNQEQNIELSATRNPPGGGKMKKDPSHQAAPGGGGDEARETWGSHLPQRQQ